MATGFETVGAWGRVDWVTLTVFAREYGEGDGQPDGEAFRWSIFEAIGESWGDAWDGTWVNRGPGRRVEAVWTGPPGVSLRYYGADSDFFQVELSGDACSLIGNWGVARLIAYFDRSWRCHLTRLDVAWDGVPFSVETVQAAHEAGQFRTKCRSMTPCGAHMGNELGRTFYTVNPRRKGIERFVRFYDLRGPTRCELVLKGEAAKPITGELARLDVEEWGGLFLSLLRGHVDYVEPHDADEHDKQRLALLPWWEAFVSDHTPKRLRFKADPKQLHALARVERAIEHAARTLGAAAEAYGWEWVQAKLGIRYACVEGEAERALVAELKRCEGLAKGWKDGEADDGDEAEECPI